MGAHMAEFVVGNIIARERGFLAKAMDQKEHKWYSWLNHNDVYNCVCVCG